MKTTLIYLVKNVSVIQKVRSNHSIFYFNRNINFPQKIHDTYQKSQKSAINHK